MTPRGLKTRIIWSFCVVIAIVGVCITMFGFYVIKNDVIARAQEQVKNDLKTARFVYHGKIEKVEKALKFVAAKIDFGPVSEAEGLDYFFIVRREDAGTLKSQIARKAFEGKEVGGTRIIDSAELAVMSDATRQKAKIDIRFTAKAAPTTKTALEGAMAIEYAIPVYKTPGLVGSVLYGGRIINRDFAMVDRIRDLVFENKLYGSKPIGTVTIFQDDVRIATNVLDEKGERAIGTRVSQAVYDAVVRNGRVWVDKAFVVTDWYLTVYEPIRDIGDNIVGILYVGVLEKPFKDMERNILMGFLVIMVLATLFAVLVSYLLAATIVKPVRHLIEGTRKLSDGDLSHRIRTDSSIRELNELATSFDDMAGKLAQRNKSYLDLVGFVAHELKGILASTILNAYSVRDGFLGMINFKQRRALDSIARNLDYLESTVKNFLNLSRIEKGEMTVSRRALLLKEEIFDVSVDAFSKSASEKGIQIEVSIDPALKVMGDRDLLQIVANNIVGNAVKYASPEGRISINAHAADGQVEVAVYNDGRPLAEEAMQKLFQKFSRAVSQEERRTQGTGLGLFITKEIVEKHGGKIWAKAGATGNTFVFTLTKGD